VFSFHSYLFLPAPQANLNLALQQEPLKLVRPEDLTKLSLMEEEEATPIPNKQDFILNHANV